MTTTENSVVSQSATRTMTRAERRRARRATARSVPANAVVTAEEAVQASLDIGPLTSLATAVKLAHWNADTRSTQHEALGDLYEAVEDATDRFVEAWLGRNRGRVERSGSPPTPADSLAALCDAVTDAADALRDGLTDKEEDLLNILADLDEAVNKARYILKASDPDYGTKGATMSANNQPPQCNSTYRDSSGVVTAAGTSEGAKLGWEHRVEITRTAKPFVGRVVGDHAAYGEELEFHDMKRHSSSYHSAVIDKPGVYKLPHPKTGATVRVGPGRIDTGFIHVDDQGVVKEVSKEDARKLAGINDAENIKSTDATPADSSCSVIHCKDESFAVKAKKVWASGTPVEFQWMPGGKRTITASYGRGKQNVPIELTVEADAEAAKAVQASFESIKGANPRRPPYGCIEHRAEERAFEPLRFSWKDDPEPAIYCECEPSELGARNVNGKIHTSFSPTFDTDADYSVLECSGCRGKTGKCECEEPHTFVFPEGARGSRSNPARVTRLDTQSVGSLTNWPAFKEILPVAASEPQGASLKFTKENVDPLNQLSEQGKEDAAYLLNTIDAQSIINSILSRQSKIHAAESAVKARQSLEQRITSEGRATI